MAVSHADVLKCNVVPHEHAPLCMSVKNEIRSHLDKVGTYGYFKPISSVDGNRSAGVK